MTAIAQEISIRGYANVLDLQADGPSETRKCDHAPEAIGGAYGVEWWEYYTDHVTGEIYKVSCWDGVNGGKTAYSINDTIWRNLCYGRLLARFRNAKKTGQTEIRLS